MPSLSYRRMTADARAISSALAWQFGEKRRAILARSSLPTRDPAHDAAIFLDHCLAELAREEARCRLALGRLLAIFSRTGAMTKLGFVRLSDYSRERLGISGSEADVTARVTRRLEDLPLLREEFLNGRMSWTKTRILAATAEAETESRWIELAERSTVRELERAVAAEGALESNAVAAVREDDGLETDGEPRARFRMRAPAWAWLFFRRMVDLARTVAGEPGPVWKAVEAINGEGIGLAPDPFGDDVESELMWLSSRRRTCGAGGRWRPVPRSGVEPDLDVGALVAIAARWLGLDEAILRQLLPSSIDDGLADADALAPIELDQRLRAVVGAMHTIDVRVGRVLRLFAERRLERELGWFDLESYVTERLGIGLRKARSLITLDRVAGEAPALRAAYDAGTLSWVRAVAILPVVRDGGAAKPWVERASQVPVRRLVDEVSWALERKVAEGTSVALPPPLKATLEPVQMRVDGDETNADHVIEFWGPASVVSTFERLAVAWSEAGEAHWKGLVRLLAAVARQWQAEGSARSIPRKEARILERDGYRCIVPCCSSRRNLQVHHLIFRSAGGGDEDWNRGALCAGHHHQCLHRFTVVASGRAPDAIRWVFGAAEPDAPLMRLDGEIYAQG